MRFLIAVVAALCVALTAGDLAAESLGDAAARQRKKREASEKATAGPITEEQLAHYREERLKAGDMDTVPTQATEEPSPRTDPLSEVAAPETPRSARPSEMGLPYYRQQMAACMASLERARAKAETTESSAPSVSVPCDYTSIGSGGCASGRSVNLGLKERKQLDVDHDRDVRRAKADVKAAEARCKEIEEKAGDEGYSPGLLR